MQELEETRLVGPNFLSPRLTVAGYHSFPWNFLPELLEDLDLQPRIHLCLMPNGASRHFILAVPESLSGTVDGRGWTAAFPAPNPDLIPLDFYFCGHLNVYCLWCSRKGRSELATINTELIWGDSLDTWSSAAGQAITVRRIAWKMKVDILHIIFSLQEFVIRKPCFRMHVLT